MSPNVDCFVITPVSFLTDSYFPGGYFAPLTDAQNNWNLTQNTVYNSIKIIKAYRTFISSDS
jgi:hypothetical protein